MNNKECYHCPNGIYKVVIVNEIIPLSENREIFIPDSRILRCNRCGDEIIEPEAYQRVEDMIELKYPGYFKR